MWTILAIFTAIPRSGDRNSILHFCGYLTAIQFSTLCANEAVIFLLILHIFNPPDLRPKLLCFLGFVVGRLNKAHLTIGFQVQIVIQTLITGICGHFLISLLVRQFRYEHKAKITILKEAARTLNYLTENNLLQYADLEKKADDIHSSYERTGKELKKVEVRLREVQPLIKNISNYQRLKPVYDAFQQTKDKTVFRSKHEAELVIFEAARSTLLAMQGDEKLPSLKALQSEQQRLLEEQQRLYDERAKLKKEAKMIDTMKANVDDFLKPAPHSEHTKEKNSQLE